jgi:protein-glutamine gamma-glutamyltransferase
VSYLLFLGVFLLSAIAMQTSGEIRGNLEVRQRVSQGAGVRRMSAQLAAVSVAIFAGMTVMAAGMFIVLPRTARAALETIAPGRFRLPGFANEVRLGQIGDIQRSNATVMHVKVQDARRAAWLKFRGSALSLFDGTRWYNETTTVEKMPVTATGLVQLGGHQDRGRTGRRILTEVQLNDVSGSVLFLPGIPEFLHINPPQVLRTNEDGYRAMGGSGRGFNYSAYSFEEDGFPASPLPAARISAEQRAVNLRLPEMDPRVRHLAVQLTQQWPVPERKAEAIESYLRDTFTYTLEQPSQAPADPIANFLFVRRKGHCEYFASAMALMLRTIGIPARVATGFQNGEYNPLGGWYVIRASDAHSWVEAYVDGYGWRTFDPTPPGAPAKTSALWSRLNLYLDALDVYWQDWVLSYDRGHQSLLVDRMNRSGQGFSMSWLRRWSNWRAGLGGLEQSWSWSWIVAGLGAAATVLAGIWYGPGVLLWWRRRRRVQRVERGHAEASDATMLYERLIEGLRRRGIEKPQWMTPLEFSATLSVPELRPVVAEFTGCYNELRFGGRVEAAFRMVTLLGQIESAG